MSHKQGRDGGADSNRRQPKQRMRVVVSPQGSQQRPMTGPNGWMSLSVLDRSKLANHSCKWGFNCAGHPDRALGESFTRCPYGHTVEACNSNPNPLTAATKKLLEDKGYTITDEGKAFPPNSYRTNRSVNLTQCYLARTCLTIMMTPPLVMTMGVVNTKSPYAQAAELGILDRTGELATADKTAMLLMLS